MAPPSDGKAYSCANFKLGISLRIEYDERHLSPTCAITSRLKAVGHHLHPGHTVAPELQLWYGILGFNVPLDTV